MVKDILLFDRQAINQVIYLCIEVNFLSISNKFRANFCAMKIIRKISN